MQEGFVPNEELQAKVLEEIENGRTYVLRKESLAKKAQLEKRRKQKKRREEERVQTSIRPIHPSISEEWKRQPCL